MIDIEEDVRKIVFKKLKIKFPSIKDLEEYNQKKPSFPFVSLVEIDNRVNLSTQSSDNVENHAIVVYEVNVYSNERSKRKKEVKEIMSIIDNAMGELGFTRMMLNPIPNALDNAIYRMVARYQATVSKDKIIYRR